MADEPCGAKCAECGLLQIQHADTREFVAVDSKLRETGEIPTTGEDRHNVGHAMYLQEVECLAGMPVRKEIAESPAGTWKDRLREVLGRPRPECKPNLFIRYTPGLSPKDHREMKLLAETNRIVEQWHNKTVSLTENANKIAQRALAVAFLGLALSVLVALVAIFG